MPTSYLTMIARCDCSVKRVVDRRGSGKEWAPFPAMQGSGKSVIDLLYVVDGRGSGKGVGVLPCHAGKRADQ